MIPVESSHLVSVGYNTKKRAMDVKFREGAIYRYYDVPVGEFEELMDAESVGTHFAYHIRLTYKYRKMN